MPFNITHQVCIKDASDYWVTIEDFHLDAGGLGITITRWEPGPVFGEERRQQYICLSLEEATIVLDAIESLLNPISVNQK